jgi:phospholipase/lecithinase/hemolysin
LAACGSSTTESAITPDRFIAFGDAYSDIGQKGSRYTVNNDTVNNWTLQLASHYQKTLAPVSAGGLSYAQGNARIAAQPDAAGDATTPTITAQIDRFLASQTFAPNDIVLLNGGISDLIVGMAAVRAGTLSAADYVAQARQNGKDLAAQILRLVNAGAPHVVVSGSYDLGKTPWAIAIGQETLLSEASSRFNEALLVAINDLGAHVLYIDSAYYVNLYTSAPSSFSFSYPKTAVCTSVDAGNGIGTGTGQVNSALCTPSTLLAGADVNLYVFADNVYLSPSAHRQLGTYAYDKLRARW